MEGVGENVTERKQFEVVDNKIVKQKNAFTSSVMQNVTKIAQKCTCEHSGVVEHNKMVPKNTPNGMGAVQQ